MQKKAPKYNLRWTRLQTTIVVWTALLFSPAACDLGLSPPDVEPAGAIHGLVTYEGTWPSADSLHDLRFVAMRFVPRDTSDFLQLNRLVFSAGLQREVNQDTFLVRDVRPGVFVYSGIAQQYAANLFAWRPVGLYDENGGVFHVRSDETVYIELHVNFDHVPTFPPTSP